MPDRRVSSRPAQPQSQSPPINRRSPSLAGRVTLWLLVLGLVVSSLIGSATDMTYQWPGFLLLGGAALAALFAGGWRLEPKGAEPGGATRGTNLCLITTALLCAYLVARALNSPVAYFGREDAALAIAWFVVFALTTTVVTSLRDRIVLIKALALVAVINLAIGFYQFSGHQEFSIFPGASRQYGERIGGVFINPNHLAAFFAAIVPLFASLVIFGRGRPIYRALFALVAVMAILGVGLTRSRGGLLALAAGIATLAAIGLPLAWMFWGRQVSRRVGLWVPMVALAVIALTSGGLAYASAQSLQQRFGANAFKLEANRQLFWEAAQQQHLDAPSPWLGAGSRAFRYEGRRLRSPEIHVSIKEAEFVHNDWLQLLADYGWIGIGLVGLVIVVHGGRTAHFVRHDLRQRFARTQQGQNNHLALTLGAAAGLAALGVHALVDFHLHSPAVALWSAVLLGLLAAPRPEGEALRRRSSSRSGSRSRSWSRSRSRSESGRAPQPAVSTVTSPAAPGGLSLIGLPVRVIAAIGGAALLMAGSAFVRSEWHFERARLASQGDSADALTPLAHLLEARQLDEQNPYIHSLSGHAHLLSALAPLPESVRVAYLKRAGRHFIDALSFYPQDIHAMMGLAATLDQLGQHGDALRVLENARLWAPLYGNIAQMEAEQLHLLGRLSEAEASYAFARDASAFRDSPAAYRGLALIAAERSGDFAPVEAGPARIAADVRDEP